MRALLAAALFVASCGGTALPGPSPTARTSAPPSVDPNLFDLMMGNPPQATAFVVSGQEVLAVTLLNHFVRYRIPVGDGPQLVTSPDGVRLYVVDRVADDLRLRRFDVLTGQLQAERLDQVRAGSVVSTESARGALAVGEKDLLLLRHAAPGLLVHAYDASTLEPRGTPAKNDGCARRLVAAGTLFSLLCPASGPLYVFWPEGSSQGGGIVSVPGSLAGAAISHERKLAIASTTGDLFLIRTFTTTAERLEPRGWTATRVSVDGLAWSDAYTLVVAEVAKGNSRLRVVDTATLSVRDHDLPHPPVDGILAAGQFAYWVAADANGVYHMDLETGLVERMFGPLEAGARLGALAVR